MCLVHVVLSTLYQEKMVTKQEVEELKQTVWPWRCLFGIQCTKPPDVVKRTTELLAEVGHGEEGKCLKGKWVYSVSLFFSLLLICCYICGTCSSYVVMWYVSTMNKKIDWYNYTVALSSHHRYVCMASYSPPIPSLVLWFHRMACVVCSHLFSLY